jgi:hypothetical protein
MQTNEPIHQVIAEMVKSMPPQAQQEVADYVDFLRQRYEKLMQSGRPYGDWTQLRQLSVESLKKGWGPEDSVYDDL